MSTPTTQAAHTNALIHATSPYLLQHAHNPVEWYEWGEEAIRRAKKEDKPIFLSIGYSACHWCHVMAHECFEDEAIAAVMNASFINIKVDREERPDLDELYMQATMAINSGQGGWPMSVWLTPDLKPFFAGTYFPPTSRWGRPGFRELCQQIGTVWTEQRAEIEKNADQLATLLRQRLSAGAGDSGEIAPEAIDRTVDALAAHFDARHGGISGGGPNKFPPGMALDLMLRSAARNRADDRRHARLMELVRLTLDRMARGGIYDQLGGGFHRYSTDPEWHVPHFEKMLYDQALVSAIYVEAFRCTGETLYARIARETFDYVIADLQSPEGGFHSTRDADSEGEEGRYYVWTKAQIVDALGRDDGELFCSYYDVSDAGNWQDPHAPGEKKNVLRVLRDLETVARLNSVEPQTLRDVLARGREKLLQVRSRRAAPGLDDKILAEWNGLMIASLARGGAVLDEPRYVEAAARAADFVLERQYVGGRLRRSYRAGKTLDTAFLSDYAFMIEGLLNLYEATFDRRWLDRAVELNRVTGELFWDEQGGGYFFTPDDHEKLLARSKDARDGAIPSGNSVQLMNLNRLAVMLGDEQLRAMAARSMRTFAAQVLESPGSSERFLAAADLALHGAVEIAIVGARDEAATQALLREANRAHLPNRVLMLLDPANPAASPDSPLLLNRVQSDGRPTAYVCRNYACQQPVTAPEDLARQLAAY